MPGTVQSESYSQSEWHVQYRNGTIDRVEWFIDCELAIETACRLVDAGCDVYGLGSGSLNDSIPSDRSVRFAAAVADDYATLATGLSATTFPGPVAHRLELASFPGAP